MVTYKNIRIKKPGGGSRMQRVKVLASGKYKFVKNKTRKRAKTKKKAKKKKRAKSRSKKSGGRKMGKKRGWNIKTFANRAVDVIAGVAGMEIMTSSDVAAGDGLVSQGLALMNGETDMQSAGQALMDNYTGVDAFTNVKKIAVGTFVASSPHLFRRMIGKVMKFFS